MLNYKEAQLHFICQRKHFIRNSIYHVYLLNDHLVLSAEKESNHPKYRIAITLQHRIHWHLNEQTHKRDGFGFLYKNELKYFLAKEEDLKNLQTLLARRIMYRDISDFFTPKSLLGKGGSSKVYLVFRKEDQNSEFAAKCIDKSYLLEDGGFQALFTEIELMQKLNHQNIIKLVEIYEGENTFYMILEYLKGKSLHDVITKSHRDEFSFDIIQTIIKQLLEGISYIHSKRIIHRDLKPENIMFKEEDNFSSLKIVDFGLATSQNVDQYAFPKCGTPGYVAPEVANLQDVTFKYDKVCDIFSIGCIFYKLITRKDLFPGNDYQQILKLNKKCIINLQTLSIYRTPSSALDLIGKMLQVNPDQRISADSALNHPFFQEKFKILTLSNNKFVQQQKMKQMSQTAQFGSISSEFIQPDNRFQKDSNEGSTFESNANKDDECDIVEDEGACLPKVPIMQKKRRFQMGSFIMKGNYVQFHQQSGCDKPIKKYQTSDFDDLNSPSPFLQHNPSLVMGHGSIQSHNFHTNGNESPFLNNTNNVLSPGLFSPGSFQSPGILKQKYEQNTKNVIMEKADDEESIHSRHSLVYK